APRPASPPPRSGAAAESPPAPRMSPPSAPASEGSGPLNAPAPRTESRSAAPSGASRPAPRASASGADAATAVSGGSRTEPTFKDALLAEIRKSKMVFYSTVCAQAQKIEVAGDRVTFSFSPNQRTLLNMFEQNRAWLESVAQQVAGRRITVAGVLIEGAAPPSDAPANGGQPPADRKSALRGQALADPAGRARLRGLPARR